MKFYFILGAASLNINSLKASKADRTPKHACMHISMPKYVHKKFFKIFLFCGIYKMCLFNVAAGEDNWKVEDGEVWE